MGRLLSQNLPMTEEIKMSRRERNLADIRDRAIPIAERIVLEEGIDALSARRLASDLGISVGSLYNAFGDLDGVVRVLISLSADLLEEALRTAATAPAANRHARVVAIGEAYLAFALAEPQRWWLLFEYRSNFALDQTVQEYQEALLEMLIRAGGGDPTSQQHRQFFVLLWASVHGLVSLACRPTIVAIDPEAAQAYIGNLVETGFETFAKNDPNWQS